MYSASLFASVSAALLPPLCFTPGLLPCVPALAHAAATCGRPRAQNKCRAIAITGSTARRQAVDGVPALLYEDHRFCPRGVGTMFWLPGYHRFAPRSPLPRGRSPNICRFPRTMTSPVVQDGTKRCGQRLAHGMLHFPSYGGVVRPLGAAWTTRTGPVVRRSYTMARRLVEEDREGSTPHHRCGSPAPRKSYLAKRRWDEPIQRHTEQCGGSEEPWQPVAHDRTKWQNMEATFASGVSRWAYRTVLLRGWFMLDDTRRKCTAHGVFGVCYALTGRISNLSSSE